MRFKINFIGKPLKTVWVWLEEGPCKIWRKKKIY